MKRNIKKTAITLLVSIALLLTNAGASFCDDDPKITDIETSLKEYDLKISFKVQGCYTDDIEKAIKSGLPNTFTFFAKVMRKSPVLFNEPIIYHQWKHTIQYNNLKDEYRVLWYERSQSPFYIKDIEEAKKKQAQVTDFPLAPLNLLDKESEFIIEVKAQMEEVSIPYNLRTILLFTSLWNFETPWRRIKLQIPKK